jgi:leucyl-tRNA synthetase
VEGVHRFLSRAYRFVMRYAQGAPSKGTPSANGDLSPEARSIQRKLHQTIKRVTDDFQGRWHFNTSISAIMELVNALYGVEESIAAGRIPAGVLTDVQRQLVVLLAPFAPFVAHQLWEALGQKDNLLRHSWPQYDAALAKEDEITIAVQINGKLRSHITVPADSSPEDVKASALADAKVKTEIARREVAKVIAVPGKLVNIVVR